MRHNSLAFGNFICRFGDLVLLDLAEEVVFPALLDTSLQRRYGETSYFFFDVSIKNFGTPSAPSVGIVGRLVKNTILRRTQTFSPDVGLQPDPLAISSAPSAHFLLLLENHRLVYFAETPDAPDMSAFALTARYVIKNHYDRFLRRTKEQNRDSGLTLSELQKRIPPPTINLVPLTSSMSIRDFVNRYKKIRQFRIRVITPNDEIDADELMSAIRASKDRVGADNSSLVHQNKEGMDIASVAEEIEKSSKSGNQIVGLSGIDKEGNLLLGNNENFKLSVPLDGKPESAADLEKKMFDTFQKLRRAQQTVVPPTSSKALERIKSIVANLWP